MLNSQFILSSIPLIEIREIIRIMFREEFDRIKDAKEEKLLSPSETCKLFQPPISKMTLTAWTSQGRLTDYRIGGRIFYKQSEILEKLTTLQKYKKG